MHLPVNVRRVNSYYTLYFFSVLKSQSLENLKRLQLLMFSETESVLHPKINLRFPLRSVTGFYWLKLRNYDNFDSDLR